MKPFNQMNLWGEIGAINTESMKGGKKYLSIKMQCYNAEYGRVRIYCNVFHPEKVRDYSERFNSGDKINVRGFMSQYTKKEKVKTSCNALEVNPWDPEKDKHKDPRATFIIVGRVTEFNDGKQEGVITVDLGKENPSLSLCVLSSQAFHITEGAMHRLKGYIMKEEDEFGELVRAQRPVVSIVNVIEEGDNGGVDG